MRPVDTAAIEAEIDQLQAEQAEIDQRLEELQTLSQQLPTLEQRRQDLDQEIDQKQAELEAANERIEEVDQAVTVTQDQNTELEAKMEEFRDARGELEDIRYTLESERESIAAVEEEISDLEDELADLPVTPIDEVDDVESRIERLRDRRQTLDATVTELQSVIQFNEEMLEGTSSEVVQALRGETDDSQSGKPGTVTDRLVDDQVVCWTCGSEVDREQIETTLDRIREVRQDTLQDRQALQSEIDDLKTEKATYEEQQRQRDQLEDRLERARTDLEQRRDRVEQRETERERLQARIDELDAEIDDLEDETHSELLEHHREANQLEFELDRLQDDLDDVTAEIEHVEEQLAQRDDLEANRDALQNRIEDLRTRIDQIEREAVQQFNDHMTAVLDILNYANLERIWIERKQTTVKDGRQIREQSVFDLHVVRSTADGTTYEDSIDHLSESEREVTGLVFALAGYLTHDIHEQCPFLLLDSIEAIDSDRIARLIDYVSEYADYIVVALLPEDAQALDDDYQRITDI